MIALVFFMGILALARPCLAIEAVEGAQIVYYYAAYDLDVEVWGQGKGYISPKCRGVVMPDRRCTFDEFVNYIISGVATTVPSYYNEISSPFTLLAGDIAAMVEALRKISASSENYIPRIVQGRRTVIGIYDDLATILDSDHQRADLKKVGIARHKANAAEALRGLSHYLSASMENGLVESMRSFKENILWKILQEESEYLAKGWNKIQWTDTVNANPGLLDRQSTLYQNTVKALKGHMNLEGSVAEQTIASKVANTFEACYKPKSVTPTL